MKISKLNFTSNLSFGNLPVQKTLRKIENSQKIIDIIDGSTNQIASKLIGKCKNSPEVIKNFLRIDGSDILVRDETFLESFVFSLRNLFIDKPIKGFDWIVSKLSSKFSGNQTLSSIANSSFLSSFRKKHEAQNAMYSLRGMLEELSKVYSDGISKNLDEKDLFNYVGKHYFQLSQNVFTQKTGNYNTRDERALNRLVTGIIPAAFYGFDAINQSLKAGKSKEEANEAGKRRAIQEIKRTTGTALSQYAVVGACGALANTNANLVPGITAGTAVFNEVTSRVTNTKDESGHDNHKMAGIKAILPPDTKSVTFAKNLPIASVVTFDNFLEATKTQTPIEQVAFKRAEKEQKPKEKKKHVITLKNVLTLIGVSILGGISITGARKTLMKAKPESMLGGLNKRLSGVVSWFKNLQTKLFEKDYLVADDKLNNFINRVENTGNTILSDNYTRIKKGLEISQEGNCNLGKVSRTIPHTKIPLKSIPSILTIPFKVVFNVVKAPYKGFSKVVDLLSDKFDNKILKALKSLPKEKIKPLESEPLLQAYLSYKNMGEKLGEKAFGEYIDKQLIRSTDKVHTSFIDNTKLGKKIKSLTTLLTTYFVVNDFMRQAWEDTHDIDKVHEAGRDSLVKRLTRSVVQLSLMDLFNNTFRSTYNHSLLGMSAVAGANTVATDCVTRILSNNPILPHNKEEQEQIKEKRKKTPVIGHYYKFVDWIKS